jgi:1-acyl-sn-glycerol-3-phosphate acyltransferase
MVVPDSSAQLTPRNGSETALSRLHKPKAGFWIRLCVAVLYPFDALLFKLDFRHLERVPAPPRGVIVAINHLSFIDTVVMARFVWQSGRVPRFMIKSDAFTVPVLGSIFRGAKQIPVYRGTADAADALKDAAAALDAGECVVIYPEGTITRDPAKWPMQGRTGIARLALLRPEVPIVPVGQWGAAASFDLPNKVIRPFPRKPLTAVAGEPLDLSRYRDAEPTATTLREITDVVMTAIRDEVAEARGAEPPVEFFKPKKVPGTKKPKRAHLPHLPRKS